MADETVDERPALHFDRDDHVENNILQAIKFYTICNVQTVNGRLDQSERDGFKSQAIDTYRIIHQLCDAARVGVFPIGNPHVARTAVQLLLLAEIYTPASLLIDALIRQFPGSKLDAKVRGLFDAKRYVEAAYAIRSIGDYDQCHPESVFPPWPDLDEAVRRLGAADLVVDLGCGSGRLGGMLRGAGYSGHLVGVDLSDSMLDGARTRKIYDELVHADICRWLETCTRRFDGIFCVSVSPLIENEAELGLIRSVPDRMKEGGVFVYEARFIDDTGDMMPLRRKLRRNTFEAALREAGFAWTSVHDVGRFYLCRRES